MFVALVLGNMANSLGYDFDRPFDSKAQDRVCGEVDEIAPRYCSGDDRDVL
jgi:hypothetical protein